MLLETYSSQNSEQLREVLPNFLKIGMYVFAIYKKKNEDDLKKGYPQSLKLLPQLLNKIYH